MTIPNAHTYNAAIQSSVAMENIRMLQEAYTKECPACHKTGMITGEGFIALECPNCGATIMN